MADTSHNMGAIGHDPGAGMPVPEPSPWQALERRVLMSRVHELEQKAAHLHEREAHLRELSREVDLLNRVSRAAHAIHRAVDLRELLDAALAQCETLVRAEKVSLLFHEPEAGELVVVKACGCPSVCLEGVRLPVGQGVAGYVALHRQPLRVEDIARDGRFAVRDSGRYATGSFLCVPVQDNGSLLGVLTATDRDDREPFTTDDLRGAAALAGELALALRRVRQVEDRQTQHRELMSKLAHEMRNPLDGALRFLNLSLAGDGATPSLGASPHGGHEEMTPECRRRYLLASKQGLERLNEIVEGLLGMGGAHAGEEPAQVNELIAQAIALQEGKAQQRGVRVDLALAAGLPPVPGASGLFQVFTNLVSNALDAMEEGGGTLRVRSERVDGSVVVRVGDTGCGMPPEVLGRLFTPFFTTKAPGRGMGLGLAVCREVMDRLRGRMDVASTPGHGTTFTVAVPHGRNSQGP